MARTVHWGNESGYQGTQIATTAYNSSHIVVRLYAHALCFFQLFKPVLPSASGRCFDGTLSTSMNPPLGNGTSSVALRPLFVRATEMGDVVDAVTPFVAEPLLLWLVLLPRVLLLAASFPSEAASSASPSSSEPP